MLNVTHFKLSLWQDLEDARVSANDLVDRSLLQMRGDHYLVHDLVLRFVKTNVEGMAREAAISRQARYLGRLDVLLGYVDRAHIAGNQDLFALDYLWRSLEELSADPQLEIASYTSSLVELENCMANENKANFYSSVGRLYDLQVGNGFLRVLLLHFRIIN